MIPEYENEYQHAGICAQYAAELLNDWGMTGNPYNHEGVDGRMSLFRAIEIATGAAGPQSIDTPYEQRLAAIIVKELLRRNPLHSVAGIQAAHEDDPEYVSAELQAIGKELRLKQ